MIGKRIDTGDILVVDMSVEAQSGKIVIASVNGDFTLKELCLDFETPVLIAHNPDYKNIVIREGDELEIFGVLLSTMTLHSLIEFKPNDLTCIINGT